MTDQWQLKEIREQSREIANRYRDAMGSDRDVARIALMVNELAIEMMELNKEIKDAVR